ncbi:PDZ domain-containing protein [Flagellimonas hymeniacidonis]|uniref:PDZ domain-containing protein n=1 Tax=Flagellimonas hymeniacidonis TaxID=2603628 RepID=A0A5C8VAQ4_9FLAO|nr:alpha/beta hydrolase [Flagellimonas hymeniacidonis]TXN37908.1 PDZ domain-containing protein [Flagellimonas hymeniacidonis]
MKLNTKLSLLTILIVFSTVHINAQLLGRRTSWEAKIEGPNGSVPGAKIIALNTNSPLQKAGFLMDDIILEVDGVLLKDDEVWSEISYGLRANKATNIKALRDGQVFEATVEFNPLEQEKHTGIDTYYEEITSSYGITQRTIITKPKKPGRQPAIVLIGGLSCSSIETYPGRKGNWVQTIKDLVEKSGMVVMRIEKPGVGDSEGDCGQSDFITDIEGYKAAIKNLKTKPYVDSSRIVVYGSSMGSALAPFLANKFNLAGVISDGTFFKTWYEHMLEIERRILQFQGNSESQIVEKLNKYYIPLYYGMLIQKKTYQQVVNEYPALSEYNYHSAAHMYGRPVAYYQQLQEFDLAGQWEKVKVPVRILRGTHDWIMSSFDNKMIVEVLDRVGHKDHLLYEYPGLDHWNTIHESPKNSFEGKEGVWDPGTINLIIKWAQEIVKLES